MFFPKMFVTMVEGLQLHSFPLPIEGCMWSMHFSAEMSVIQRSWQFGRNIRYPSYHIEYRFRTNVNAMKAASVQFYGLFQILAPLKIKCQFRGRRHGEKTRISPGFGTTTWKIWNISGSQPSHKFNGTFHKKVLPPRKMHGPVNVIPVESSMCPAEVMVWTRTAFEAEASSKMFVSPFVKREYDVCRFRGKRWRVVNLVDRPKLEYILVS